MTPRLVAGVVWERVFELHPLDGDSAGLVLTGAQDSYRTRLTYRHPAGGRITDTGLMFLGGHVEWTLAGLRPDVPTALVFRIQREDPFPGLRVFLDGERVGQIETLGRVPTRHRPGGWEHRTVGLPSRPPGAPAPRVRVCALEPDAGDLGLFTVAAFQATGMAPGWNLAVAEAFEWAGLARLDLAVATGTARTDWAFDWDVTQRAGHVRTPYGRRVTLHVPLAAGEGPGTPVSGATAGRVPWRGLAAFLRSFPDLPADPGRVVLPGGGNLFCWSDPEGLHFVPPPE